MGEEGGPRYRIWSESKSYGTRGGGSRKTSILVKKGHCFGEICSFIPKIRLFGHPPPKKSLWAILDHFLVLTPKQLHCQLEGCTEMAVVPSKQFFEMGGFKIKLFDLIYHNF